MARTVPFLTQPTPNQLRRKVLNICDSYSNPWDVLAELLQNSVDAINLHERTFRTNRRHQIVVSIDQIERAIAVYDTGIGFAPEKLPVLLGPDGTDKLQDDHGVIGQKGVGLTYAIFTSRHFRVKSRSVNGLVEARIDGARDWKEGAIEDLPQVAIERESIEPADPSQTYTEVTLRGIEEKYGDDDLLRLQPQVVIYLLRSKTAIGSTRVLFGATAPIPDVKLEMTMLDGSKLVESIDFRYFAPHEALPKSSVISLRELQQQASKWDAKQKARHLRGKCVVSLGSVTRGTRRVSVYVFMAHSRSVWREISNLIQDHQSESHSDEPLLCKGGIYVATRGMPTGVELTQPQTGQAAYWPLFHVVLEDDSLTFDLGRKSIPPRTHGFLKDIARDQFNELSAYIRYVSDDVPPKPAIPWIQQHTKAQTFQELQSRTVLGLQGVNFLKQPSGEEASVVALFHELVGCGLLRGYYGLRSGHRTRYDLWARYRVPRTLIGQNLRPQIADENLDLPLIIEFKYKAEAILNEIDDDTKFFPDIDLLVCWDLDRDQFQKHGVIVEVLKPEDVFYYGSNYQLTWPGSHNLGQAGIKPVLALRQFVEDLVRRQS